MKSFLAMCFTFLGTLYLSVLPEFEAGGGMLIAAGAFSYAMAWLFSRWDQ